MWLFRKSAKEEKKESGLRAGSMVEFGRYPQGPGGEIKPIQWWVLALEDNCALMLSCRCLDAVHYNDPPHRINWPTCTLRTWLNETFFTAAFNEEEQAAVIPSFVCRETSTPGSGTTGEDCTEDKVFLLSKKEVSDYCRTPEVRASGATAYASSKAAWQNNSSGYNWYKLRSYHSAANETQWMDVVGNDGEFTAFTGDSRMPDPSSTLVRPAVRVNIQALHNA